MLPTTVKEFCALVLVLIQNIPIRIEHQLLNEASALMPPLYGSTIQTCLRTIPLDRTTQQIFTRRVKERVTQVGVEAAVRSGPLPLLKVKCDCCL